MQRAKQAKINKQQQSIPKHTTNTFGKQEISKATKIQQISTISKIATNKKARRTNRQKQQAEQKQAKI